MWSLDFIQMQLLKLKLLQKLLHCEVISQNTYWHVKVVR